MLASRRGEQALQGERLRVPGPLDLICVEPTGGRDLEVVDRPCIRIGTPYGFEPPRDESIVGLDRGNSILRIQPGGGAALTERGAVGSIHLPLLLRWRCTSSSTSSQPILHNRVAVRPAPGAALWCSRGRRPGGARGPG